VVGLLKYLGISKADFFGESYGGNAAAMIAIRYPELVGRVVTYAATFGPPQIALNPQTTHFDHPPTADSRNIQFQRENYKKVAPDPNYWPKMFDKLGSIQWEGFSKRVGFNQSANSHPSRRSRFCPLEHAVETVKLIPNAELAVIPSAGHFVLFSEQERVIPIVKHFLEKPEKSIPLATAETGYHPGETR
jgi:pimeloyl-ACP methyl ester carboxylesterase